MSTNNYRMSTTKTWKQTYGEMQTQFQRWAQLRGGVVNWTVDNMRGQRDVTLRYTLPGEPEVTLHMNQQWTAEDNLRVLYLAVQSLRLNEVRGIADVVKQAYLALPGPAVRRDPFEVLGVRADAPREVVDASYKAMAKRLHPDGGGDVEAFKELQEAYEAVTRD